MKIKTIPQIEDSFSKKDIAAIDFLIDLNLAMFLSSFGDKYRSDVIRILKELEENGNNRKNLNNGIKVYEAISLINELMGIEFQENIKDFGELYKERKKITNKEDYKNIVNFIECIPFIELNDKDIAALSIYIAEKMKSKEIYKESTIKKTTLFGLVNRYLTKNPLQCSEKDLNRDI